MSPIGKKPHRQAMGGIRTRLRCMLFEKDGTQREHMVRDGGLIPRRPRLRALVQLRELIIRVIRLTIWTSI
jgi:hypothetical protein